MKPQLHISGLDMLQGCGEQYRRRYIEGERIPPGLALIVGTATDRAVSEDLQAKIDTGALLPDEQIADLARDTVAAKFADEVWLNDEDGTHSQAEAAAIDTAVTLSRLHHVEHAPTLNPTHVQRSWTLEAAGLPVDLVGTIDIQEPGVIRDTKTKATTPAEDAADKSLQLTTYALAVWRHDGAMPEKVTLDFLVKTKKPKLVVRESTRDRADFGPLIERIGAATRAMESGIFVPARPDDWRCSAKFCGYYQTCRFALKPKTVIVPKEVK